MYFEDVSVINIYWKDDAIKEILTNGSSWKDIILLQDLFVCIKLYPGLQQEEGFITWFFLI